GTYVVNITANDTVNNEAYNLIQVDVTTTPAIGLTLDSPTLISVNVTQNRSFTVQVTVSCFNANCGEVNVSLDPYPVENNNNLKVENEGLTTQSAINLYDNQSFLYDIQDSCDIIDGQSDVFDYGLRLYINNTEYTGLRTTTEDSGREAFCDGQTRSLLNISRKVYVPKTANWSRYLEVLHNPTAGTVCVDAKISSNMGSDGSDFMNTSDYNRSWEVADHWMMWDDTSVAAGDDAAGFVYQQDGATETIDTLSPVTASGGANNWVWEDICVGAGSTKVLMHFFTQHNTRAESEAEADDIYTNFNDDEHLSGMSDAEKNAVVNWAISSTVKGGLVSTNTSATPFYTTTTNPYNLSLNAGESETITFTINATGTVNQTYEFFVYANITSDMTIGNETSHWNVTIINDTIGVQAPSISVIYPVANGNYITDITAINYSFSTTQIINECWASTDSGVTNTSKVTAGINFTGLVSTTDSNIWTVYCDDNNSLTGAGTVTFTKQPVLSLAWVTPTKNINVTQNKTFTVSATLTCTNTDCNNVNVTLDPVGTPVSCKELYSQGSITDGEYTIYPDGVTAVSVYCDMTRNDGGWTLFANMDYANCAESLTFGNNNLTSPTSGQYLSRTLGGLNHSKIMMVLNDTGGYKFDYVMNFSTSKNLSQRFIDFVATGEVASWVASDGTNDYTGVVTSYRYSDGAGLTSSGWGSRTTFSADDGTWGVANASSLDGNGGPYLSGSTGSFGFENANSGDTTCNGYFINGAKTASTTWIANAYIKEDTDYGTTTKSGVISTVNGTTPFYVTDTQNPINISIAEGGSSTITWNVNASGDQNVTHEFFVYANWTSNQSVKAVTRIWNITISNSTTALGPTITVSSPAANSFTTNTGLDILYTATSATLDSCWYTANGGETNTTLANCINITGKTWGEGETTATIYANDTDNLVSTASVTFTIDLTNPTLSIIAPSNGANTGDNGLDITYIATDTNRDSCWYSNDTMTSNTTLASCANITIVTWNDGNHNITVWVNDSVNNVVSDSVTFTLDSITPTITLVSPSNNTNTTNSGLDITYIATDNNRDSCWYSNDTMTSNTTLASCANITSVTWNDGQHNVTIWVNDTFGNVNLSSVTFNVDSITPIITMISPDNNTNSNDNTLDVNYVATDTNRDSCWYSNDTMTSNTTLASCANITSVTWNDGQHNVTVWVNDSFGNSNSTSVTFNVDTTNPTLTITSPTNNTNTNDNDLDVNFTITDANLQSCWYNDDDGSNTTLIDCANITTVNWIDGTHVINLWANDSAGNSNSASVTFVIDASSSTITFIDPTPSNTIAQTTTNVITNVSIVEPNLNELKWNWNGTNYTIYNNSIVVMMNFDNISALGENDTHVFDVSGNGNNGTTVGGPIFNNTGKHGGAFDFDGINDYVNTSYYGETRTLSFWFKTNDFDTMKGMFGQRYDAAEESGNWQMHWDNDAPNTKLRIYTYDSGVSGGDMVTSSTFETGTWYHIAITSEVSDVRFYVDGAFDSKYTWMDVVLGGGGNDDSLTIGGSFGNTVLYPFNGSIDEVRIWNRTLSAVEVYQQYASNLNKFNQTQWYLYVNQSKNATTVLSDGDYTYYASAKDTNENENITTTRTITIDTTNPTITISSPTNGTNTTNTALNVNYTATDLNRQSCWYSNDTMTSNTTLTGCANITSVTWSVGNHNVTVWVNDTAGNKQNNFVTFTILPDVDNDGVDDANDPLLYNESNVTQSGITKLNITVGGNRTNETYSGKQEILFYDQNTLMINFSHNFSSKNLDLSNVTIIKDTNYLIVNFSGQLQGNKTLFITDNSFITLCVKDAEVSSIDALSSTCDEANETLFTSCLGNSNATTINGTTCTDLGTTIKVENLQYSAIRGTVATPAASSASNAGGGGGGSSGGGNGGGVAAATKIEPECQTDAECSPDKTCYYNQCVKLFDVKVLDVDSPIGDDGLLGFTYFIKGMADINGDVVVNFWLEKDGEKISSGQDVIYLGSFEEKTEQTKIFVPQELTAGAYEFYVQVSFENYQALSHRTIFVEEKDGLLEVRVDEPSSFWKMIGLIFAGIVCLLLIIVLTLYLYPKFKRREPETYANIEEATVANEQVENNNLIAESVNQTPQNNLNNNHYYPQPKRPTQRYYWDPKTKNIFRDLSEEKPVVINKSLNPWISRTVWDFSKWPKKRSWKKRVGNIFRERSKWAFPRYTSIKVKILGRFYKKKNDWKFENWK
ncbi:hypothetical protein HOA91_06960, partial [Candidatus Woesearchaeota archaeon]|nr:hypothetical protein [Candidatus Woesearchaeota archaeon]